MGIEYRDTDTWRADQGKEGTDVVGEGSDEVGEGSDSAVKFLKLLLGDPIQEIRDVQIETVRVTRTATYTVRARG